MGKLAANLDYSGEWTGVIFVGSGALLWRACAHAAGVGATIDAIVYPQEQRPPDRLAEHRLLPTEDVNALAATIAELSSDGLVCSTGNPFIFRKPVLDLGLTIVNIHGAPLPKYRGLPISAAVFALLRSESEFGVTLHRVDAGIDTGAVIDQRRFEVSATATLEELSLQVTEACHEIFVDNLASLDREPSALAQSGPGEYFGMRSLKKLAASAANPEFDRATDLGMLEGFYPEYAELFASIRANRGE